jgi:hypothetical protein
MDAAVHGHELRSAAVAPTADQAFADAAIDGHAANANADDDHLTVQNERTCRVCRDGELHPFAVVEERRYERCSRCLGTLVAAADLPDRDAELNHYLNHENDIHDQGYRRFVSKLVEPLSERLPPCSHGLDYGCGPGPVAAAMLRERGFTIDLFDPFFAPDESLLDRAYDFIVCSEVVEHFHRPAEEFDRLAAMLKCGGILAIMTCFQDDDQRFSTWHYRRDPTHVAFYRLETLANIARARGWSCESPVKDVALLRADGE